MVLDTTLYITEAISKQKIGYNTIDKHYKAKKEVYYISAQKNKYYNHSYILEGTINQVEYAKKFLGILEYCKNNIGDVSTNILKDILKASFPYLYNFMLEKITNGAKSISLTDVMNRIIKKNKGIANLNDDNINSNAIAFIFLCQLLDVEIDEDSLLENFITEYVLCRPKIKESYLKGLQNNKIQELTKENRKKYNIKELNNLTLNRTMYHHDEWFSLFTPLDLSIDSIFSDTKEVKNIIDYLTLSYNANFFSRDVDVEPYKKISFDDYIIPACIIFKLAQAYNDCKTYHFKNNKENMYIELNNTRNKLNDEKLKNANMCIELEDTQIKLNKTLKEVKSIEKNDSQNIKELIKLRELFFELDNNIDDETIKTIDYKKLEQLKDIVIIGGTPSAQQRIKNYIPNSVIIVSENFDTKLLNDKNLFLFYKNMSHSIYYKAIKTDYKSINYFKNSNIDLCLNQIYNYYFTE